MGARGYVAFDFDADRRVVLSTHWDGREVGAMLQAALRAWPRYQSGGKLASLVHREMSKPQHDGGTAISPNTPSDADLGGFVVDLRLGTIRQTAPYTGRTVQEWTYDEFVAVPEDEFHEAWLCAA